MSPFRGRNWAMAMCRSGIALKLACSMGAGQRPAPRSWPHECRARREMNFPRCPRVSTGDREELALLRPLMPERNPTESGELQLYLLVLRCQAGDERAFAQLMEKFERRTLEYVRGLLGDPFLADDVQQEVWLAVYLGIRSLDNPGAFRTWLFRITRHRTLDFVRRRKRESELFDDAPPDHVESP